MKYPMEASYKNMELATFQANLKVLGYTDNTISNYSYDINKLLKVSSTKKLSSIPTEELNNFLNGSRVLGLSSRTRLRLLQSLKLFYSVFDRPEITSIIDDHIKDIQVTPFPRDHLSEKFVVDLIKSLDQTNFFQLRNSVIITFLYFYSLRIEDVLSIKPKDLLDPDFIRWLTNEGKFAKLPDVVQRRVDAYYKQVFSREYLFVSNRGLRVTRKSAWRFVQAAGKAQGKLVTTDIFRLSRLHNLKMSCYEINLLNQVRKEYLQEVKGGCNNRSA